MNYYSIAGMELGGSVGFDNIAKINSSNHSNLHLSLAWPDHTFSIFICGGIKMVWLPYHRFLCCRIHRFCAALIADDKPKRLV